MGNMVLAQLIYGVILFVRILSYAIIANALLSWFISPDHPVRKILGRFIDPIVRPFRGLTDRLNTSGLPIDISPLLAYFALLIIAQLLTQLYYRILI